MLMMTMMMLMTVMAAVLSRDSDIDDIHSVLEVFVYDENPDKKVDFLGKLAVPLLRVSIHSLRRVQIAVATLSGNSLRQTVYTHRASVHQAAKLVAALLSLKGCGGNCRPGGKQWQPTVEFMIHVTCRLSAKNRDQLRNPTLRSVIEYGLLFYIG